MNKKPVVICTIYFLLCGCVTTETLPSSPTDIGSGNINFSVSSTATYRYYTDQKQPKDFVITVNGYRGFYTYCTTSPNIECRENTTGPLLDFCSEQTGESCRLFGKNGQIVWKDPGLWQNSKRAGMHFFVDHQGIRTDNL